MPEVPGGAGRMAWPRGSGGVPVRPAPQPVGEPGRPRSGAVQLTVVGRTLEVRDVEAGGGSSTSKPWDRRDRAARFAADPEVAVPSPRGCRRRRRPAVHAAGTRLQSGQPLADAERGAGRVGTLADRVVARRLAAHGEGVRRARRRPAGHNRPDRPGRTWHQHRVTATVARQPAQPSATCGASARCCRTWTRYTITVFMVVTPSQGR